MIKINGLPGIGTAGKMGNNGNKGISVFCDSSHSNISNSFYIDEYFNMYYNEINGKDKRNIYNSSFYNLDNFKLDVSTLYFENNLLIQKNIFSKIHQKNILPEVDYKFTLLNDTLEDYSFINLIKDSSNLELKTNTNKYVFSSNDKIYLNTSNGAYHFSKEQKILQHINNNLNNLFNITPFSLIENNTNVNGYDIYFNKLYEYLINELSNEEIKNQLKIDFIINDKIKKNITEKNIKNFKDDMYELYKYISSLPSDEYDFSYYIKITIKNDNDNIYQLYIFVTSDKKEKINKDSSIFNDISLDDLIINQEIINNKLKDNFEIVIDTSNLIIDDSYNDNNYETEVSLGNGAGSGGYNNNYYDYNNNFNNGQNNITDYNGAKPGNGNNGLLINDRDNTSITDLLNPNPQAPKNYY